MNDVFEDFESDLPNEDQQLAALVQTVRFSNQFSLVFAVCNDIQYRETLISRLQQALGDVPSDVLRLTEDTRNLLPILRSRTSDPARALFVVGIEGWIPSGTQGEGHPFILNLNATRNALPGAFSGTLVLWTPEYLLATMHSGAPDFFSVRSGVYSFAPTESERTRLAEQLTSIGWSGTVGLSKEDQEDRIARLLALLEDVSSSDDWQTKARLETSLATTYLAHGQPHDALPHAETALSMRQEGFGDRHPDTLRSMNNLASTYGSLGRNVDALRIEEEVLAVRKEVLGDRHPDTLSSMGNLAGTYRSLGRHADALRLEEEVLAVRKEVQGDRHPDTLTSMGNLAVTYWSLGRHADALRLQEEVLAISKEVLGDRHPGTLTSMHNLATTYSSLGRHADALRLDEEVLAVRKEVLGDRHPDTLTSINNLATTYSSLGRHADALGLNEEVLAARKEVLGDRHPDTLGSMNNLASTYEAMGKYGQAKKLFEQALEGLQSVLGSNHPNTNHARDNLNRCRAKMQVKL